MGIHRRNSNHKKKKVWKRCSQRLIIRKAKVKTVGYHLHPSVGKTRKTWRLPAWTGSDLPGWCPRPGTGMSSWAAFGQTWLKEAPCMEPTTRRLSSEAFSTSASHQNHRRSVTGGIAFSTVGTQRHHSRYAGEKLIHASSGRHGARGLYSRGESGAARLWEAATAPLLAIKWDQRSVYHRRTNEHVKYSRTPYHGYQETLLRDNYATDRYD